jgi:hypothetical protein
VRKQVTHCGFVERFTPQRFGLDRLDFFELNSERLPRLDISTKNAARREVYSIFAHLLREHTVSTICPRPTPSSSQVFRPNY